MPDLAPPIDTTTVEFTADRVRIDGSRSFWATIPTGDHVELRRWDVQDRAWSEQPASSGATWLDCVAASDELAGVRADEATNYTAADVNALLEVLSPRGDGSPNDLEWDPVVEDSFGADDDEMVYDNGHVRRWAEVNGQRLSWALSSNGPVPLLGGWEEFDGTQIAYFSWDNGWGCGHSELTLVNTNLAIETAWVDQGEHSLCAFRSPEGNLDIATIIESWVYGLGWPASGPAILALTLEPLDPNGTLSDEERNTWAETVNGIGGAWTEYKCAIELSVSEKIKDELRRSFRGRDHFYDRYRAALAEPKEHEAVRELLSEWDTRGGEW